MKVAAVVLILTGAVLCAAWVQDRANAERVDKINDRLKICRISPPSHRSTFYD